MIGQVHHVAERRRTPGGRAHAFFYLVLGVVGGLVATAIIVDLTQNAGRSSSKPSPIAPMVNSVTDAHGNYATHSVTDQQALPASSRNGADQGDLRLVRSPSVLTNAPMLSGGGPDTNRPFDKSELEIDFANIRSTRLNMSDEEFEAYAKTLTGNTVTRRGWISAINKLVGGSEECSVDMDDPATANSFNNIIRELPPAASRSPDLTSRFLFPGHISNLNKIMDGFQMTLFDVRF